MFYSLGKPHFHPFSLANIVFWHLSFSISHFRPLSCFCSLQTELLPSRCDSFSELLGSMTLYEKIILKLKRGTGSIGWQGSATVSKGQTTVIFVTIVELQEHYWLPNKARQSSVLNQVWNGADVGRKEVTGEMRNVAMRWQKVPLEFWGNSEVFLLIKI